MAKSGRYLLAAVTFLCSVYWIHKLINQPSRLDTTKWSDAAEGQEDPPVLEKTYQTALLNSSGDSDRHDRTSLSQHDFPETKGFMPSPLLPDGYTAAFPRHIWQTSSKAGKTKYVEQMQTWKNVKGFEHHWLSDADADEFVRNEFSASRPSLVSFWENLSLTTEASATGSTLQASENTSATVVDSTASSSIVLRADLLRYMLMYARGGVYSDIDTSALLHVDRWIPENHGSQIINAVIGIEYDDTTYKMFTRPISFCQWTLMAKPGHPIFDRAINRVVSNLDFLARRQKVKSLGQLKLDKLDVLEATGPGMISDVVLQVIQDQLPDQKISWATFHDQKEGRLFGDVLILPINGFAGSQKHSHAGNPLYGELLVQHHFGRSWYQPKKAKPLP